MKIITTRPHITVIIWIIVFCFVMSTNAQETRVKTLREIAQEKSVEIPERDTEAEREEGIGSLASKAEAIVLGQIDSVQTSFGGEHNLRTDYTIHVKKIIKDFQSAVPLEMYDLLAPGTRNRPLPLGDTITLSRYGGVMEVNGNQIFQRVLGYDQLRKGDTFIFFLTWSPAYEAYSLAGGISGAFLVQSDSRVRSLASKDAIRDENLRMDNQLLEEFLKELKKKIKNNFVNKCCSVNQNLILRHHQLHQIARHTTSA